MSTAPKIAGCWTSWTTPFSRSGTMRSRPAATRDRRPRYGQAGRSAEPRPGLLLEHLPGDDQLLNLRSPLVDPEQPHVAVQPFDRDAPDVAGTAVDLHRPV